MKSQNRFWNSKTLFSKLLACLLLLFSVAATTSIADDSTEGSDSVVWIPAAAVANDSSAVESSATTKATEGPFPWVPGTGPRPRVTDSQVVRASYEEPVESKASNRARDLFDPGLIVPLEEMPLVPLEEMPRMMGNSAVGLQGNNVIKETPNTFQKVQYLEPVMTDNTMVSGSMVPGSMRVLQTNEPMMVMGSQPWEWQILPSNLLWHSYLAGPREPRISSTLVHIRGDQDYWDATLGGRVSLLRFGNTDPESPEGVEIQVEGAAFPRLTLDYDRDLVASDYRFGFPLVYRRGALETKFSYYHLSSHFGDEYLIKHPAMIAQRINYSRDALALAVGYFPWRDLRLYGEVGYAVWCDGGSRPWEFQFGADYSPVRPTSIWGAPFFAVNGHLHQELNYSGGFTAQAGIQWRGQTGRLLRFGFQYFNGMSEQYQFYRQFEQQIGGGIWYDF